MCVVPVHDSKRLAVAREKAGVVRPVRHNPAPLFCATFCDEIATACGGVFRRNGRPGSHLSTQRVMTEALLMIMMMMLRCVRVKNGTKKAEKEDERQPMVVWLQRRHLQW
jgi:hypothetical protein